MRANEFEIIQTLTKRLKTSAEGVVQGIGDDAACVMIGGELLLISNDDMRENVHFRRDFPPRGIGYKLIAANASDILACGGVPKWINLSVGFPPDLDENWAIELYDGVAQATRELNMVVTGGNVSRSDRIQLGGAVFGTTTRFVSRGGAKIGDDLWLSASLGDSRLGLDSLLEGAKNEALANMHLYPKLALALQPLIAAFASSAIDISDGFLGDVGHLAKASGVGFEIDNPKAMISNATLTRMGDENAALDFALNSGEEYRLLFTAPIKSRKTFLDAGAILIGRAKADKTVAIGGKLVETRGFSHF
ncbi:MAG: thiamine-phosphate kinase [Helicobacteraceae bacterium]|jgi:thiamine-monophosphate kinase|nr:thiamine-phosphate kinase [Helicobacteraceae bacterium]